MSEPSSAGNQLIISYLVLRRIVGLIGTALPFVLLIGLAITSTAGRPDSMSGYYYTDMRNIFVGALWALGVFLGAYNGHGKADQWITNVAGLGAIGVALCPTKPAVPHLSLHQQVVGDLHLGFAAITFVALGVMALRFARGQNEQFRGENALYRGCGVTILVSVAVAALSNLLPASVKAHWPTLFVFETIAVVTFGVSWLVKGQTMQAITRRIRTGVAAAEARGSWRSPAADGPGVTFAGAGAGRRAR
jgi:hypothetical protein